MNVPSFDTCTCHTRVPHFAGTAAKGSKLGADHRAKGNSFALTLVTKAEAQSAKMSSAARQAGNPPSERFRRAP